MITVRDIALAMEEYAPKELAENWDNVGLLVGSYGQKVSTVLVALDGDDNSIAEAVHLGADVIITHHPIIFGSISAVTDETVTGALLRKLISNNISLFTAHTNLDTAEGGVNDVLAQKLSLENVKKLYTEGFEGSGRMGNIKEQTLERYTSFVKDTLDSAVIKRVGEGSRQIKKVGVCGGSGGHMIDGAVKSGCDLLVVGEAKYSDEQKAAHLNLCLIEAGHFETENVVCHAIKDRLLDRFKNLKIFVSNRKTTYYE